MTNRQRQQLKKDFLKHFAKAGNISATCRKIGINRTTVYQWQEMDEDFLMEFRQAELESTERLEKALFDRATKGVTRKRPHFTKDGSVYWEVITEYSDTAAIFLLKARKPETYRERVHIDQAPRMPVEQARELLKIIDG